MSLRKPDQIDFITNRCHQGRFLLLPTTDVRKLQGAWLAKSLAEHGDGIELYAFAFLSNHFHMLLRDPKGTLPEFMAYFQLNLAKAVNRHLGRRGHFFARKYRAVPVPTDDDFESRYAYIATNAVKGGLVSRARGGPFFSSLEMALGKRAPEFEWVDLTQKHQRSRRGQKVPLAELTRRYGLELSVPPAWRGWSKARRRKRIEGLVKESEVRYRRELKSEGTGFLGTRGILAQSPLARVPDAFTGFGDIEGALVSDWC